MKVNYRIKDTWELKVGRDQQGFIVFFNESHRPDPDRYFKVKNKLIDLGFEAMASDHPETGIALGGYLRSTTKRILWTSQEDYPKDKWVEIPYDRFVGRNITIEKHES